MDSELFDFTDAFRYETPKTIAAKIAFVKKQCLSGVLIWAVDLDPSGELLLAIGGQSSTTLLDAEYCPRSGDWETTKRGSIVKIPCPLGDGEITRTCGEDGKWGDVKADCDDIESGEFIQSRHSKRGFCHLSKFGDTDFPTKSHLPISPATQNSSKEISQIARTAPPKMHSRKQKQRRSERRENCWRTSR